MYDPGCMVRITRASFIPRESHKLHGVSQAKGWERTSWRIKCSPLGTSSKLLNQKKLETGDQKLEARSQELKANMRKPIKYVEKAVVVAAKGAWAVFDRLNRIKPNPSPTPKWSDKPLLKSYEKSKPPLGWPRSTDSLCPKCVPEIRQQILDGTCRTKF